MADAKQMNEAEENRIITALMRATVKLHRARVAMDAATISIWNDAFSLWNDARLEVERIKRLARGEKQ